MRALRESLHGEPISRVLGIINGTTNFILTKMTDAVRGGEADYAAALAEAQRLGYAERDPTADVEGFDAGAKAAIIATVAFGAKVVAGDVYHEGISGSPAPRSRSLTASATSSSCSASSSATRVRRDQRPRAPGDGPDQIIRWPPCATASTRCSSKAASSIR